MCFATDPYVDERMGTPARAAGYARAKAAADAALALAIGVVTAPVLLLAILLVKVTSRGPVIYKQTRVGHLGQTFTIYKVRTMAHDCERVSGPQWSVKGDPRVTRVGAWLRRTHLDELPQLWNVLRGEMSLVGPRPERPVFVAELGKAIPRYHERHDVRPGVTGLAQVYLPADTDLAGVRRKLVYDLYYAENLGPALDLRIVLCTALGLLAVPYGVSHRLLGLPGRDAIERGAGPAPGAAERAQALAHAV